VGGPESLNNPLLTIGAPPDAVAWAALAGAVFSVLASPFARRWLEGERRTLRVLAVLALGAAALSAGYIAFYLRGGPRIVDATSYWLEARALSEGHLAFSVPDPSAAFRGRFLVSPSDSERLAVIFPPGYPALLAGGFLIGAPLAVGPLIAAALVVATFALCRELFGRDDIALVAALFSVISATLRYHTADTMSHGWSALLMTLALLACFRARRSPRGKVVAVLGGLAAGWLFATRPVTGVVALALGAVLLLRSLTPGAADRARFTRSAAATAAFLGGAIPGVALLLLHQRAATGDWLGSSQLRYYELADGPPGCFRYGFGAGIGCLHEHGDFVRARLSGGFGFIEALSTTLRRLQHHALDVANFEPLVLMVLFALVAGARVPAVRWLGLGVAGVVLAYLPFYFDGTYPGGGARFYADVLPLEHALLSWGLVRLRAVFVAIPLALLGFSVHGVFSHRALAQREGGRPMFDPALLERAGISRGLVFVDTDHGFNLGHVPEHHDSARTVVVARGRGDGHDRAVWEVLGRPSAYRYRFDPFAQNAVPRLEVERFETASFRFESEAQWPVLSISGGWARPQHTPLACASGARGLYLSPTADRPVQVGIEAWSPRAGAYDVRLQVLGGVSATAEVALLVAGSKWVARRPPPGGEPCWGLTAGPVQLDRGSHRLVVETGGGEMMVDYVELSDAGGGPHPSAQGPGR
jgi:hypothetical protein